MDYEDLEPYYARAEVEMGVAGEAPPRSDQPRSTPYPMRGITPSYMDRKIAEALAVHGLEFKIASVARNTRAYDGRPACRGNNNCFHICPIGAQYAAIVHVHKTEQAGARVVPEALAVRLEADASGLITDVRVKRPDNGTATAKGRVFVLAANGLETPRLLLQSHSPGWPNGLANSSDQVGRNLMDHLGISASMLLPEPVFTGRGPTHITLCTQYSDGLFRRFRAAGGLGLNNKLELHEIAMGLLEKGLKGETLDRAIRDRASRQITVASFVEQLPDPSNRVSLDAGRLDSAGLPRMRIHFDSGDYSRRGAAFMRGVLEKIAGYLDAQEIDHSAELVHANHMLGATRMGANQRTSVVAPDCRTHDHRNLFIASGSVFPSSGGTKGPTLTIAALSLRIADSILKELH